MTGCNLQRFDLFKAAMGNPEYLNEICKNTTNQTAFMATLEEGHLTYLDILESIQIVQNPQVKSLLIIYLLSQNQYLEGLNGDSILNRLGIHENHIPSRLNALIHQLDIRLLTPTFIEKLQPEAAVSILCSVSHFHQLTRAQIEALIAKYFKHELIVYWLNHFCSMPNSHYVIAHLIKIAEGNFIEAFSRMSSTRKEIVITKIIEHLGLFNNIPEKFLKHANEESYLILAMRLYLNGHYNKAYVVFINQLADKLLEKNFSFSDTTVELFFFLNDKLAFKKLAARTARLTQHYLRTNAQTANIDIFYHDGQINIERMIQEIHINSPFPNAIQEPPKLVQVNNTQPHLTDNLFGNYKLHNCFEYFLVHYNGHSEHLYPFLNQYLEFYENSENLRDYPAALYHLCSMLHFPQLTPTIKEVIITSFLKHPDLLDESLCKHLFLFDAKKTINYFGLQGGTKNYQTVIKLCKLALKNLNPQQHEKICNIAQKALTEAEFELNISKKKGGIYSLLNRIKRCFNYGWKGFFRPNSPVYVAPVLDFPRSHREAPRSRAKNPFYTQTAKTDLPTLLNEITAPLTVEKFRRLIRALNVYAIKPLHQEELSTRQKLQDLYHQVMVMQEKTPLHFWLKEHEAHFIKNQFRMIELLLKEKQPADLNLFLKQFNEDSDHLFHIYEELTSIMPEWIQKHSSKLKSPETANIVSNTSKVLSDCATTVTECAQNALSWAGGVAESLFLKMKKEPRENEDDFVVEHIASFFTQQ